MKKTHKAWLIVAIILTLGGGWLLYRYIKNSKKPDPTKKDTDATKQTAVSAPVKSNPQPPSVFPLKNGSPKNDSAKALQTALGVTADGLFGPKTEAALKAKTGKTQITNQAEYDQVISQLTASATIPANTNRAKTLYTDWKADSTKLLMAIVNTTAFGITEDYKGALTPNNKNVQLKAGVKLNRSDYVAMGYTNQGFLKFSITTGTLAGLYKVDPNAMTLVIGQGGGVLAGLSLSDAIAVALSSI